jgi:carbon-monoxide dehydrogenase large subunit
MSFLRSRTALAPDGIGKPVRRREDVRLVTGAGRYTDDVSLPDQAYAAFVRSPHAHARIRAIDTRAAHAVPGVLAVLMGAEAVADGVKALPHRPVPTNPHEVPLTSPDGAPFFIAAHLPLAVDVARFVGEAVAMVVAESAAAARDAAEVVLVDYEPRPAVSTAANAVAAGAPRVWDEAAGNVCVESHAGDGDATAQAFARATHVVRLRTVINRVTGVPMEPRAALAVWAAGRVTLYAGSGGSQRIRGDLAGALELPEDAVRVVAQDVGGNYGTRNSVFPEFVLVAWAARRLGRPAKWTAGRREAFLTDYHARDLAVDAELALDRDGTFLALRSTNTSNVGAYIVSFIPLAKGIAVLPSVPERVWCAIQAGR